MDFLGNKKGDNNHNSSKKDDDYEVVWTAPKSAPKLPSEPAPVKASDNHLSASFFARVAEKQKENKPANSHSEHQTPSPAVVKTEIARSIPLPVEKPAVAPANFLAENLAEAKKEGFVRPEFDLKNKKPEPALAKSSTTVSSVKRWENSFWQYLKKFLSNLFFDNKKIHPAPQVGRTEETEGKEINNPKILEANLIKREPGTVLGLSQKVVWLGLGILIPFLAIGTAYFILQLQIDKKEAVASQIAGQISGAQAQVAKAEAEAEPAFLFKKRLAVINSLLGKHIYWTNFFRWLEANTLAEVSYLNGFDGDLSGKYKLTAKAQNYVLIEKQVSQLAGASEAIKAGVESAKTAIAVKDALPNVEFNLNLEVKPEIFYQP